MKKDKTGFLVLMLLMTSALLFQSCKADDPLRAPATINLPSAVTLSSDGSSSEVAIAMNQDDAWSAAIDGDWCTITPSAGVGSGKFVVTALVNKDRMPRSVAIVVTSGKTTASIIVWQKDTLNVKAVDNIIVANDGGVQTIDVEANTVWEVIKPDIRAYWVDFTPKHGSGKGTVTITIKPNELLTGRSTELVFSAGNATRVITILQQNIAQATSATDSLEIGRAHV